MLTPLRFTAFVRAFTCRARTAARHYVSRAPRRRRRAARRNIFAGVAADNEAFWHIIFTVILPVTTPRLPLRLRTRCAGS